MGFELTALVVLGIDYTCSCKSNYHSDWMLFEYAYENRT